MPNRSPNTPGLLPIAAVVAAMLLAYVAFVPAPAPKAPADPCPGGKCPAPLAPTPRPNPWGGLGPPVGGEARGGSVVAGRTHDGEALSADLPGAEHVKNIGSRRDGAGMCVMSSITMAAVWQGLDDLRGLREWCANEPGGAYPGKVDDQIRRYCAAKRIPVPEYVQYEGGSPEQVLDLIDRTRRMACITYGTSPRYNGQTIAHMVCSPKFSGQYGVALDNNWISPPEQAYEWMSRAELIRRIKHPSGRAWVFAWLATSPPLPPYN